MVSDARSQGISSNDIDIVLMEYSSLSARRDRCCFLLKHFVAFQVLSIRSLHKFAPAQHHTIFKKSGGAILWYIFGNFTVASYIYTIQCQQLRKIFTGLTYKFLLSFMVMSDVYRSFIPNKTVFTRYFIIQRISKLPGSFEIHRVRLYLLNFTGLAGIVNATVYWTEPIFTGLRHGKLF